MLKSCGVSIERCDKQASGTNLYDHQAGDMPKFHWVDPQLNDDRPYKRTKSQHLSPQLHVVDDRGNVDE